MYMYHALINALNADMIHINYDILYTCRAQSYQNNLHKLLYGKTKTHTHYTHTHTHTHTHTRTHARTHARTHEEE